MIQKGGRTVEMHDAEPQYASNNIFIIDVDSSISTYHLRSLLFRY